MLNSLIYFAQKIDAGKNNIPELKDADLLANTLDLVYYLAGAVSIIVIIVAGIMYVTATGDSGRISKAKNMLTYAIAGLVVVMLAFTITHMVIGRF